MCGNMCEVFFVLLLFIDWMFYGYVVNWMLMLVYLLVGYVLLLGLVCVRLFGGCVYLDVLLM